MRKLLFLGWSLVPVAALAWHYGPGTKQLAADRAGDHIVRAAAAESRGDLETAATEYRQAMAALPQDEAQAQQRLRLAQAQVQIRNGNLVEGQQQLGSLLQELERDAASPPELARGVRHSLAESCYYAAMIMRREGAAADDWLPEAERARQHFRLLAEKVDAGDAQSATAAKRNLEATIKLEQMDLSQLLAAAPPSKCPPCKGLCKRKKKNGSTEIQGDGKPQDDKEPKQEDARKTIQKANGAGTHQAAGSGS